MLRELFDIVRSVFAHHTKVSPPETLLHDHNLDEYVMYDTKRNIIDFALAIGTWPSELHCYKTGTGYGRWTGHSARTLKKRVK